MGKRKRSEKEHGVSIKTKLLGIILPVVIVIVIVLVGVSYSITKASITRYSTSLLNISVENQGNEIEAWLNENLAAFQSVKHVIETTHPDDAALQQILDGYYGVNANYPDGLYIAGPGHFMKASESSKSDSDPTQSTWYREGLTRVNMGLTGAYTDSNGNAVISAAGILDDGLGEIRVISADLSLERISIIVNSFIGMDNAQAFLVNRTDNTILAHRDNSLISTALADSEDEFLRSVGEYISADELDTVEIDKNVTAFAEIGGTDWVLVSYVPTSIIYEEVNSVRNFMTVIGIISVLLLAILIVRVVSRVISPVKELTKVITAMTDGDFTVQVKTGSSDEIGVMSRSVERFIATMRGMIASIYDVSNKLHDQAHTSNDVSGEMYDATKAQGISMKELNETVEQLSLSVNEIAENATTLAMVVADTKDDSIKVNERMQQTVDKSRKGKADMQNVSSAMENMNESVTRLQAAIDKVGKASDEITNITGVIGSIADETNLLSLNASIEAARAGEAGRGFAVVATQIGQLAQTSAESVRNIDALISEIHSLVRDAVAQAEESVESINDSSRFVGGALETFDAIFENIDAVSNLVDEMIDKVEQVNGVAANVAAISQEQAASSEEILATSDAMVEQANNITGNSETVANGATALNDSAAELSHQVEMFRIGSNDSNDSKEEEG